jgi:4-amino-4-deoxy-L-arabinose transferase-like glycosyltransferase
MTAAPHLDPAVDTHWGSHGRKVALESIFLVLLVAASFLVRLWGLSEVRFWDEAVYLQNAEVICGAKTNYSELDSRPPLLSIVFAGVFLLWNHVYAACITTALLNALGPAFLYFGGRLIAGRIAAGIAALLLAFSPFFVGVFPAGFISDATGNGLLSDGPALTLILLAFWLLVRALRQQTDLRFAAAGFVLALAVLMRFASLSTVGVLFLLTLAANRWWKTAVSCGCGFIAGVGPYLFWSRFRYGGFLTTFRKGWGNFEGPGESAFFYVKNFGNIFSWITLAGLVLWIGGRAWGRWQEKQGERLPRLEVFLWLWAAALLLFFSALHHKEPRYVMPVAPPLLLLAGIGLSRLPLASRRDVRVAGTVLLVGALTYTFLPDRQRFEDSFVDDEVSEDQEVSEFLNQNLPPGTVLYSNFNYPVFAWYTNLPVHQLPESGPTLYDALNHLPGDGIVIAYKPSDEIAEPRLEWLDSNPHFRRFREFQALVLYEHRK